MKSTIKFFLLITGLAAFIASCDKADDLPFYGTGTAPVLTASATTIAPQPADSNNVALTLNWSYPQHATDSGSIKYTIQIDSAGKNFSTAASKVVIGQTSTSFTAKELNDILLGKGYAFNVPVDMDVRIISSYANNNEQLSSNTVRVKMTPYIIPPKVEPPTSNELYIVGSATAGGWNNPVPVPTQRFTRVSNLIYEGTFFLNAGGEYLLLPVNGSWDTKFAIPNNNAPGVENSGDFRFYTSGGDNFKGPSKTGLHKIAVDFQSGTYTVEEVKPYSLLYVPGDYQGWDPATASRLGSPNADGKFEGYINFPSGGSNEFKLTTTPDWSNALGDDGSGKLSSSGGNLKVSEAGYYRIVANTSDNTWSAMKTTWSIIGGFTNWSNDIQMTFDATQMVWKATVTVGAASEFKFRANNDWSLNYGDNGADGSLEEGGADISIPSGTHTIILNLNNPGYFTYSIQ